MEQLAAVCAAEREPGDVYLLQGQVGAGKSAFSRAYIRHACGDDTLPVPSPTFLLVNTYDEVVEGPPIHHFDLYRLPKGADLGRLDVEAAMRDGVCLVEWPDRLDSVPSTAVVVALWALPQESMLSVYAVLDASQQSRLDGLRVHEDHDERSYEDTRWRFVMLSSAEAERPHRNLLPEACLALNSQADFVALDPHQADELQRILTPGACTAL